MKNGYWIIPRKLLDKSTKATAEFCKKKSREINRISRFIDSDLFIDIAIISFVENNPQLKEWLYSWKLTISLTLVPFSAP